MLISVSWHTSSSPPSHPLPAQRPPQFSGQFLSSSTLLPLLFRQMSLLTSIVHLLPLSPLSIHSPSRSPFSAPIPVLQWSPGLCVSKNIFRSSRRPSGDPRRLEIRPNFAPTPPLRCCFLSSTRPFFWAGLSCPPLPYFALPSPAESCPPLPRLALLSPAESCPPPPYLALPSPAESCPPLPYLALPSPAKSCPPLA